MAEVADALRAYGSAWNERDADARIGLLREALAEGARYTDSEFDVVGVEAISDAIAEYHRRFPNFAIRATSAVDGHHDCIRFTWAYEGTRDGEEVVADGADAIVLSDDGRLQRILVFDGAQPPPVGAA